MNVKAALMLCLIYALCFLFFIREDSGCDVSVSLTAAAMVTLMMAPFLFIYCRRAEKHVFRFIARPTWANAFRLLFPPRTKKDK